MFPLSHVYVSTKATNETSPLLILGSILPDICSTSKQHIGRDQIHNSPKEFFTFVNENYPELTDLGLGVCLHSQVGRGADFYSDDPKTGYAKLEGSKISRGVAVLMSIPDDDTSLTLAHNFIEMAIDLHLYQNERDIWNVYNEGIEKVKDRLIDVAICMSDYLKLENQGVLKELHILTEFLSPQNFTSKETAAEKMVLPLINLRFQKNVSNGEVLKIIDKSMIITKPTYKKFLDDTVEKVKENILRPLTVSSDKTQ